MSTASESIPDLLRRLSALNVHLKVHDGQLHVDAPTGALTPELQNRLRANRDHLVALLQSTSRAGAEPELAIVERPDERYAPFPLNPVQHAYWIGRSDQLDLGGVSSHVYFEIDAERIDLGRLSAAFNVLVRRHEMLRAVVDADGQQRILPEVPHYAIAEVDLRACDRAQLDAELQRVRSVLSARNIDCAKWPLFEIRAATLPDDRVRLFFSWDFIFLDAWSLRQVFHEWHRSYAEPERPLPPLTLSFRDYVLAELQTRRADAFLESKAYWQRRLPSLPDAPLLPLSNNDENAAAKQFSRRTHALTPERWRRLKTAAQKSGLTPSSLLLAAFAEVIDAWSKSSHYCVNLTLFNRQPVHAEIDRVVGDFTNLLLLEIAGARGETFRQRAERIQEQFLRDFEHRRYGAVDVLRDLAKLRHAPRAALAPVVFTSTLMLDASAERAGDLEQFGSLGWGVSQTPQVLLDYQLFESNGVLRFNWDAVENRFQPGVLDGMFAANCELLDRLADDDAAWDAPNPVQLPQAQRAIRTLTNETRTAFVPRCLHAPFIEQALQKPDAIAVIEGSQRLSYGELLAEAAAIADALVAHGIGLGDCVAVVMDKRCEQVAAIVAVLIAGAAYVPIDPDWPARRRDAILAQCAARAAVVNDDLLGKLPAGVTGFSVRFGQRRNVGARPAVRQTPDALAYVIFTSGSTGSPKGVMIDHRSAMNTIDAVNDLLQVCARDRILMVSDATFDLSVYDIFGMFSAGGCVVLPQRQFGRDPAHWSDQLALHAITIWNSVPQLMALVADVAEGEGIRFPALRKILLSGDWIPTRLPPRLADVAPHANVISLGGATEGSIWSIYYPIHAVDPAWASIPYGKPLPNQRMHVLDKRLEPRPDWVVGDIYIGGDGVALGYLNDPGRTAERFVVHPRTKERLYWTGDLGRQWPDGNIEFLGREDAQIKLRGYRIELGEIASSLCTHPLVADAAVRAVTMLHATALVAYVVPREQALPLYQETGVDENAARRATARGVEAAGGAARAAPSDELAFFREFWRRLEAACTSSMRETLATLGLLSPATSSPAAVEVRPAGVGAQQQRLLRRWMDYLRETPQQESPQPLAVQIENLRRHYADDARVADFLAFVLDCLREQSALLSGRLSPLALLFPDGDWRFADALYRNNAVVRQHNATMAAITKALFDSRDERHAFRVIELGAGTGGSTQALLDQLPAAASEYLYTDVSSYFFEKARARFAANPQVKFATFDINKSPKAQGVQAHSYDLVVAANVLHNAIDLDATLTHVRDLLKPGGHLLMLEGTALTPWSFVSVGFLEAGEGYADQRARTGVPILGAPEWLAVLGANRFEQAGAFPGVEENSAELMRPMPQCVFLGRAPARIVQFVAQPLLDHLAERLPDYMLPQYVVALDKLPLSANGKVDLDAMPAPIEAQASAAREIVAPASELEGGILAIWRQVLGSALLGATDNFFDAGGDSLLLTEVQRRVKADLGHALTVADLFRYPTVRALAQFLGATEPAVAAPPPAREAVNAEAGSNDIAIIGMAGRFPDARDVAELWHNLVGGACAVRRFTAEELLAAGVAADELQRPRYVKAGPVLADMPCFDAHYFGVAPAEAKMMDPQQRFLLECAVETLESAGYPQERAGLRIGVFAGKGIPLYTVQHVLTQPDIVARYGLSSILRDADKDHAATLISYKLNLTGPSLSINTACSTSLVAVHVACHSLLAGECEIALAGGASFVTTLEKSGYLYEPGQISAPDGVCKAFSEDANGTVFGCGVGLVALRPLGAALRDRDNIIAVIKGSAINNDGAHKVGYTAPSIPAQAEVVRAALSAAGVPAQSIQYIEAHGTGTPLGDPIEVAALREVFGAARPQGPHIALASIKTNIGHLDSAAGVAGLIKAALALRHRKIPASLHVSQPSSKLGLGDSPFFINTALRDWQDTGPRRAGVSSFGVGGTNAHVVLEEAPQRTSPVAAANPQLFVVSAKSQPALRRNMARLAAFLEQPGTAALPAADVAFTLQAGRTAHLHRRYAVADGVLELQRKLQAADAPSAVAGTPPRIVFLFPGQGVPLRGIAELYARFAPFREPFDECAAIVASYVGFDLRQYAQDDSALDDPSALDALIAQPLCFAVEYALAQLWQALGVRPSALLGHSLGEYVAACIAGVFSLEEVLSLVVARGQLSDGLPAGKMLAVAASESGIAPFLQASGCSLAAVNSPEQCVISGSVAQIDALRATLQAAGFSMVLLRVKRAYHSAMVDAVLETFSRCVAEIARSAPKIPLVSSMTGAWLRDEQATSVDYWVEHLRKPVRFADGLHRVRHTENTVFVEVGVGHALSALASQSGVERERCIASVETADPVRSCLEAIGELWAQGLEVNWPALHSGAAPGRVELPTYAFEKERHWLPRATQGMPDIAEQGTAQLPPEAWNTAEAAATSKSVERSERNRPAAPRDVLESKLTEIWCEYLGVETVDVDESFFDLGGDSMLGARVHARIEQEFGVALPIEKIFELATIRRQYLYLSASLDPSTVHAMSAGDVDVLSKLLSL